MESFWPALPVVLVGLAVVVVVWHRRRAQRPLMSAGAQRSEPNAAVGDVQGPGDHPAVEGARAADHRGLAEGAGAAHHRGAVADAGAIAQRGDGAADHPGAEGARAADQRGASARRRCERRCEQAVQRCLRAVEAVTAESARSALVALVRRMDAELPTVRALVALGDELSSGADGGAAIAHVDEGLAEASRGFEELAAEVLSLIDELPRLPGGVSERTARLRSRFPLAPPMSAVTRVGEAGAARERGGQAVRAG